MNLLVPPPQILLWQAVMPTDRQDESGTNSADYMEVALWLQNHPEYSRLTVACEAPVNWGKVHAVLASIKVSADDPMQPILARVKACLGRFLGIPVP